LSLARIAKISLSSSQISQITSSSGTFDGVDGSVFAILNYPSYGYIYIGGHFNTSAPNSALSLVNAAYYDSNGIAYPVTLTTSAGTGLFYDTDTSLEYLNIVLPQRYKLVNLVYDKINDQWIEAFRSLGVTH
jgi:hypothetical protein